MQCKCCLFDGPGEVYQVREMQLGLRELFNYHQCSNCGALQLIDIPENLAKYYPSDKYYSYNTSMKKQVKTDLLRKIKAGYILYGKNKIAGSILSIGYKKPEYFDWLKKAKVEFDDAILDVGCGDGGLLVSLGTNGFTNLTGIDPFNQSDFDYGSVKIFKKDIFEIEGHFDFIMLNHVFEHLDNPKIILKRLYQLLKPRKYLLLRTPVMGTYAWKTYKENWMGLDAPRHLIVHTLKSIHLLAEEAGFKISATSFDGIANNLIASEQYKRDIPLTDTNSYMVDKQSGQFTQNEIAAFKNTAERTNREQQGDQAAFFLYKP